MSCSLSFKKRKIEGSRGRLQGGMQNDSGYGKMFCENTLCSGTISQICAIMGASTGGGVYSPALINFIKFILNTNYIDVLFSRRLCLAIMEV
jgi:acetyl-CoA carboxylase carboxyltransferase component